MPISNSILRLFLGSELTERTQRLLRAPSRLRGHGLMVVNTRLPISAVLLHSGKWLQGLQPSVQFPLSLLLSVSTAMLLRQWQPTASRPLQHFAALEHFQEVPLLRVLALKPSPRCSRTSSGYGPIRLNRRRRTLMYSYPISLWTPITPRTAWTPKRDT